MSDKKHGLGKGITSLFNDYEYSPHIENVISKTIANEDNSGERLKAVYLDIKSIRANVDQPRKTFDKESLAGLASSIKEQGVIQPITVEEYAPHKYSIVAGERRFRAATIAGLEKIPAIIVTLSDIQRLEMSLIENIQRENLNAIEEAAAYEHLISKSGYTQEEVAKRVGKSRSAIANSLRLLTLPDTMKDDVIVGTLSAGHARAILSLNNPLDRDLLRDRIINEGLSVREAEELATQYNNGQKLAPKRKEKSKDPSVAEVEQRFISIVGARCEIKGNLSKGKLLIKFRSQRDLEHLFELLSDGKELFD